ncbi:MAG: glycosyltransferase [Nitrospirales bacterium]|nr:glycosyltransferase [Nitrospirales bacterium]
MFSKENNQLLMRILFAITVFYPSRIYGGPATVAMNQARELVARGHEVNVVTSNVLSLNPRQRLSKGEMEVDGVHVKYFPTWIMLPRFPALISFELWKWLKDSIKFYDVVHVHFARDWIPVAVANAAIKQKVPVFLQPHGMLGRTEGLRTTFDKLLIRRMLERATGVLSLQETEQRNIASIAPNARTIIVPNGVTVQTSGRFWTVDSLNSRTVLFLARLHPHKRVQDLIDAVGLLRDRGLLLQLRIVGPDEGDLPVVHARIRKLRLPKQVEIIGPVPPERVSEELLRASLYVLPSISETFPMAALEAMALGVPTIVTEGIQIRELLERHRAAMVVPSSPLSIADAIQELLETPGLALQLSINGRRLIASELTLDKVIHRLENIYQRPEKMSGTSLGGFRLSHGKSI